MSHTIRRRSLLALALLATLTAACGGGSDSTGPTPAPAAATITVVNNASNGTVMFLRHRACGSTSWGSDHLGSGLLSQGEQISFDVDPGCYDVRATPAEVGLDYLYFSGVTVVAGESKSLEITAFPLEP